MSKKRYWENWDDSKKREDVERFWMTDPQQSPRRMHFNSLITDVARRGDFTSALDFSCGTCEDYPHISSLGLSYTGVDITKEMLDSAREKFPGVDVSRDDIFKSKFGDKEHPLVINSAVLPHLPLTAKAGTRMACVPRAIRELWRITGGCLVVRLFGVDLYKDDRSSTERSFIYNRLRQSTWEDLFKKNLRPGGKPKEVEVHRGKSPETKDIMVVVAWR